MAELEIHHESEGAPDPVGQKVGVLAAVLAVALAIVTIASHRAHTDAVLLKTEANDRWSFYQSKRIKLHSLELGEQLVTLLGAKNPETAKAIEDFRSDQARYEEDSKKVMEEAQKKEGEATRVERRALRYDVGEGLLEIALVLSSLYFISRKMLFPVIGIVAGIAGAATAILGFIL
ncbi:MAG TPA: DUF4337 domain-containing protein [Bryobacteraceae bacterium]|jgi:hypothetical protein|nr:DUF4337 domain-containing protein [Bryobacteraceae bacterium]